MNIVHDALNSSVSAIIITNLEGEIKYANSAFLKMFLYEDKSHILGLNAARLFPTKKVTKFADVKAIIDETTGETEEFIAQRKDGARFPVEASSSNVTDGAGNIVGRMASFIDLTEHYQAREAVQDSKRQIRALSSSLLEAEEKERKRIAGDLHDIMGSSLTAIKYSLEKFIQMRMPLAEGEDAAAEQILSMVKDTIKETKRISRSLRPSVLDDLGLLATIRWACREFEQVYDNIRIEKIFGVEEEEIPEHLKIVIYRLLQECLNNIAKHSRARHVQIHLTKKEGDIYFTVVDDGQGFDLEAALSGHKETRGLGLASMKERAQLFGGMLEIDAVKGGGTAIQASWPL